jgi:DNA-directed RNA polymerase subunit RPC12/RpoP
MEHEMFKKIGQYQYSSEAYIFKGKLESEGIEVFIRDHNTINTDPLVSNAIGGVKLFVRTEDYPKALQVMDAVSDYSLDENGRPVVCPACHKENVQLLTTVKDKRSWFALLFALLFTALPIHTKYVYKCNNCNHEFENQ